MGLSPSILDGVKTPRWDLARVQKLATEPNGVFVQMGEKTKAAFNDSRKAATDAARATIAGLTVKAFAHSLEQTWDVCDVYGVKMADGSGWYLKLTVDEEIPEVAVVSFHPLERDLKTNGGTVKP
jgi:hypothetical protein